MCKALIIVISISYSCIFDASAQSLSQDSLSKIGRQDGARFHPDRKELRAILKKGMSKSSDFFKPHEADASNAAYLTDSAYVTAYREAAYMRAVRDSRYTGSLPPMLVSLIAGVVAVAAVGGIFLLFHKLTH